MEKHRRIGAVLLMLLRVATYASLLAAFVLMLSVTNPQILRVSRTTAITVSSFTVLLGVFTRIYGGFRIGEQKSRPIIYQMALTALLTDIITYLQLQIMNVNAANNESLELFGVDILLLAGAFAIQLAIIVGCTYLGNYIFFRINPPQKCCVVTASARDRALISSKIQIFDKQFTITDTADYRDSDVHEKIKRSDTIMLFHLPANAHQELIEYCYKCQKGIYFDLSIADILAQNAGSFLLDDVLLTAHTRSGLSLKQRFFKRALDIAVAVLGLVVTSPLMLAVAIAIKLDDGDPVFYRQDRLTRGDRIFRIYKFRTMRHEENAREFSALKDDERITRVGRYLRALRIDELPQLVNILKGEMSVVGPRPEILSNFNRYITELPEYSYRCRVKAGLTGYAQIAGKYNTGAREKLMMDISYIENYSFWLDIKLILKTATVFFREDSTEPFEYDPSRADDQAV
ncbi:MAG: sugar transferase [Christensenellales bacterium]|jgi:lipopolysaccharide/colanic/teichoic acid biosynthesis glycosyltransferase